MLRLGLVGHPVAHSRSPLIQGIFAKSAMIPAQYELFDVSPSDLGAWLAGPAQALDGFNVTAPHKEAVFAAVATHSPEAARLRAVNTVRRIGASERAPPLAGPLCGHASFAPVAKQSEPATGSASAAERRGNPPDSLTFSAAEASWQGHNTDLSGFLGLLGARRPKNTLVIGAGGAARAVVAGLADRGIALTLAARRPTQAASLLAELGVVADVLPFAAVPTHMAFDLVIDCAGVPEVVALPWERLPPQSEVMTLSYGASAQPLRAAVAAAGRASADGLLMLIEQARAAFAHWTGHHVPDRVARVALEAAQDV